MPVTSFSNLFKVKSQTFILLWCKKCEKLEKEVILVINGVSTTYLCKKNEEKGPILSVFCVDYHSTELKQNGRGLRDVNEKIHMYKRTKICGA